MPSFQESKLIRIQVWLPEPLVAEVRAEAAANAIPVSSVIRQVVVRWARGGHVGREEERLRRAPVDG